MRAWTDEDYLAVSVIGGVLCSEGSLPPAVLDVQPEYFQSQKYAEVWDAILANLADRKPVDSESVVARMVQSGAKSDGLIPFVCWLENNCPCVVNLDHWAKILIDDGKRRLLGSQIKSCSDESASAEEIADRISDIMRNSASAKSNGGLRPIREGLISLLSELQREWENPDGARCAGSGIATLDAKLRLERQQLTIIAGRPSMGKSALAGNIACYCARDKDKGATALFSLEMSASAFVRRMVASEMRANTADLSKRVGDIAMSEAMSRLHGLNLFIDDRSGMSVGDMRRSLMAINGKVRLVLVDYLQLARMADAERHDLKVGAVTKELKSLAKEFDCHVIALCQLNRQVEQRKPSIPQLSDLRDSGNIEEDADNVLMLYRPFYYGDTYNDRPPDEREAVVIIAKQRNGERGRVDLGWDARCQTFYDIESR